MATFGSTLTTTEIPSVGTGAYEMAVFSATSIDGKATGNTSLGTVPSGKTFVPLFAITRVTSANTVLSVATASIGTNSPNYNDLVAATALTGVSALNSMLKSDIGSTAVSAVSASTQIFFRITVGATATAQTLAVDLVGYFK